MSTPHSAPPPLPTEEKPKPPLWLVLLTILVVFLNAALVFLKEQRLGHVASYALGNAIGQVLTAVIVAFVVRLGKQFRNARAFTYVILCVSGLMLLSALGNLAK